MEYTKEQFNNMIETNQIDIRPNNKAYIGNIEYEIQPIETYDKTVTLKEIGIKKYEHPYILKEENE